MAMIRKQVYIAVEQDRKLKRLSDKLGVSEAEIIRRCVDEMPEDSTEERTPQEMGRLLIASLRERASSVPGTTTQWRREDSYYGARFR